MQAGTILIVDDNKSVLTSLELLLEDEFEGVETASNPNSILSVLDSRPVDLVLLDMNFSAGVNTGNEGLFWLRRIREIAPELPVIMLTAYGDVELAVRALKGGAADFVLKPWDNDNLIGKIRAALHERKSSQLVHPVERPSEPAMIIGHSPVMMKLIKVVTKVAKTDANVLITGENGTGKETAFRSAAAERWSTWIWEPSASRCSKASCSGMNEALLRMRARAVRGSSRRHTGAHCFSTRSIRCLCFCSQSFCGFCRTAVSAAWAAVRRNARM